MQEAWIPSLTREEAACCRSTKLVCHNYWACAPELRRHNCWACAPWSLCSATREASTRGSSCTTTGELPPLSATREKACAATKTQHSWKQINKWNYFKKERINVSNMGEVKEWIIHENFLENTTIVIHSIKRYLVWRHQELEIWILKILQDDGEFHTPLVEVYICNKF